MFSEGGQEDRKQVHYRDTVENIGVPWQLTKSDQMEHWGLLVFQLEQVGVHVSVRERITLIHTGV